jgi:hypothetical protein
MMEAALVLKKVVPCMLATALASIVLPVPGGPKSSTPCHWRRGGGGLTEHDCARSNCQSPDNNLRVIVAARAYRFP